MMKTLFKIILLIGILTLAAPALAKPILKIDIKAEIEIVEIIDGKKVVKIVPAEEISSGQTIIYTLKVTNSGDQPATKVNVTDPIPKEANFLVGSAFGDSADITYSIDSGKSYKKPSLLTYKVDRGDGKVENRIASPEQYTNIKWVLDSVLEGSSKTVGFKALVK